MGNHTPTVLPTTDGRWVGKCTCRWRAPDICDTQQGAEDSNIRHLRDVERVLANARRSTPSLKHQRDYYESMAQMPDTPLEEAALWKQLADEISRRLNEDHPATEGQEPLW